MWLSRVPFVVVPVYLLGSTLNHQSQAKQGVNAEVNNSPVENGSGHIGEVAFEKQFVQCRCNSRATLSTLGQRWSILAEPSGMFPESPARPPIMVLKTGSPQVTQGATRVKDEVTPIIARPVISPSCKLQLLQGHPAKCDRLTLWRINVGPASQTVAQHKSAIEWTSLVFWDLTSRSIKNQNCAELRDAAAAFVG